MAFYQISTIETFILFSGGGLELYRNHFLIRISNTNPRSDPDCICIKANSDHIPPPTCTISCLANTICRYAYFSRLSQGHEPHRVTLCEMLVIGYTNIGMYIE